MSKRMIQCRQELIDTFREKGLDLASNGHTHKYEKPGEQYGFKVKLNAQNELDIAVEMSGDVHRGMIAKPQDFTDGDYLWEAGITYHPNGVARGSMDYFAIEQGRIKERPTQYFNTRDSPDMEERVTRFSEEMIRRLRGTDRLEATTMRLLLSGE